MGSLWVGRRVDDMLFRRAQGAKDGGRCSGLKVRGWIGHVREGSRDEGREGRGLDDEHHAAPVFWGWGVGPAAPGQSGEQAYASDVLGKT